MVLHRCFKNILLTTFSALILFLFLTTIFLSHHATQHINMLNSCTHQLQHLTPSSWHDLPGDLVRYHLLAFLNSTSAVKVTQTSRSLFNTLRFEIRQTTFVSTDVFLRQSNPQAKRIGSCNSVHVTCRTDLNHLTRQIRQNKQIANRGNGCHLLHMKIDFADSLWGLALPDSIRTLIFGFDFNHSLVGVTLPHNLQMLTFGFHFNRSLARVTLPSTLQKLVFGDQFNQPFAGVTLPDSLLTLEFGFSFNQSLAGISLPCSLQTLIFGYRFNQPLHKVCLPATLQTLICDHCFNQSLDEIMLPSSLQTLSLGWNFNQSLIDILRAPSNLVIRRTT